MDQERLEKLAAEAAAQVGVAAHELETKLEQATGALAAPASANVGALVAATDLPEIDANDPLGMLATRLDREADLMRSLALRQLSQIAWQDRLSLGVSLVFATGVVAVAGALTFALVLGGEHAPGRALLGGTAVLALLAAAFLVDRQKRGAQENRERIAERALARAAVVEGRVFATGLLLEWRKTDPALYQEALARAERDPSP